MPVDGNEAQIEEEIAEIKRYEVRLLGGTSYNALDANPR